MNTTAQQAKDTTIFVIENGEVVETTIFVHVAGSARKTTSPRGVMYEMFVEEVEIDMDEYGDTLEENQTKWALKKWSTNGRATIVELFDTEEDADDEWFRRHEAYDFVNDDQRDTRYWFTEEEALSELAPYR